MRKFFSILCAILGSIAWFGLNVAQISLADSSPPNQNEEKNFEDLEPNDLEKIRKALGWDEYLEKTKQMSFEKAKKRWGQKKFSAESFKKGDWRVRAPLAVDLLASKKILVGMNLQELRKSLGKHDGFFWRDSIPAYIIEDGLETGKDSWQLVFFIGMDDKVHDIRIYENN